MSKMNRKLYERLLMPVRQRFRAETESTVSPLLTRFECWSDKKRKLFFQDYKEYADLGVTDFELDTNTLAGLIASPMRSERNSRSRAPKGLLIQLKPTSKKQLKPIVHHYRSRVSTYICNNKAALSLKMCDPSLWKTTQHLQTPNDLEVPSDKTQFLTEYAAELQKQLCDSFSGKDITELTERAPTRNDVQCHIDRASSKIFTTVDVSPNTKILAVNIASSTRNFPQEVVESIENKGPLILRNPEDSLLISVVYKTVSFEK